MRGDQNGPPLVRKPTHDPAELDPSDRVHPAGGLVQQQDLRLVQQRLGQHHALHHATRQGLALHVAFLVHAHHVQAFIDPAFALATRHAVRRCEQVQHLPDLQIIGDRRKVGHVAEDAVDLVGLIGDIEAGDLDLAVGRLLERRHHADRAGFACPVRPDEAEDMAGGDLQGQTVDRGEAVVVHSEIVGLNHHAHT